MKTSTLALATLPLTFAATVDASQEDAAPIKPATKTSNPSTPVRINFDWRQHQGDFPKDKPGYLILTTEDALSYSKFLPMSPQKRTTGLEKPAI